MPRLGAPSLARTLAVDAPGTKVIYMSGYPHRGVPGGRKPGPLGPVLQKPFTPGELLDWIRWPRCNRTRRRAPQAARAPASDPYNRVVVSG